MTGSSLIRILSVDDHPVVRDGTAAGLEFRPGSLLRDRHGALWIGAVVDSGLLHTHEGRTDLFTRFDGLSGNTLSDLLEDREGNVRGRDGRWLVASGFCAIQQAAKATGRAISVTCVGSR